MSNLPTADITVISFGYRHGAAPEADFTADVRRSLNDPLDTDLRHMTGLDPQIRDHVRSTSGAYGIARTLVEAGERLLANTGQPVVLAFGCGGGRHRAVALAELAASFLRDYDVEVVHRDIDKPVLAPLAQRESST